MMLFLVTFNRRSDDTTVDKKIMLYRFVYRYEIGYGINKSSVVH